MAFRGSMDFWKVYALFYVGVCIGIFCGKRLHWILDITVYPKATWLQENYLVF